MRSWPSMMGGGAWSPLDDAALTSGLYLPGGYATTGTPGTDQTGQWTDMSGNGRHFTALGGVTAPTAHARGYPVFDGINSGLACIGKSFNGDFAVPDNGAIVVIAQVRNRLEAHNVAGAPYSNTTLVMGSGATPGIVASDLGAELEGFDTGGYIVAANGGLHAYASTLVAGKWDAIGLYTAVGGAAWDAVVPYNVGKVSLSASDIGADTYIGIGYGGVEKLRGIIKAVAFYPNAADVTDAKLAQWQAWAVAQGLVSAWSPRDDAGTAAGALWMPGGFDPATGWVDSSGNGWDAVLDTGVPTDENGCPVFDGTTFLRAPVSPADNVTYPTAFVGTPNDGGMIVIAEQRAALQTFDGTTYDSMAPISGTGATPQVSTGADRVFASGFDGVDYAQANASSGIAPPFMPHLLACAWDAVGMYAASDEDTFGTVGAYPGGASLNSGNIGNTWIGKAFAANYMGKVSAAALYKTKAALATALAKWRAWAALEELAAPFSPLTVPGARVWYDLARCTSAGGVVTALPDQSGKGNDAIISAGNEPTFTPSHPAFNGIPAMEFSGGSLQYLDTPDLNIATGAPLTFVVVGDSAGDFLMSSINGSGVELYGGGAYLSGNNGGTNIIGPGAASPSVLIAVFDGASSRLYTSAKTPLTADGGPQNLGAAPNRKVRLGMYGSNLADPADWSQNGFTTHALVYDGAPTQAECEYLLEGFGALTGIPIGP